MTIEDEDGKTDVVKPADLKNIKKAVVAKPGNDLEVENQTDGASVGIKEAKEYVRAQITDPDYSGPAKGQDIMIRAVDYTKGGENDEVEVVYSGDKITKVPKKFIEPIDILERKNLYETGVYNSEMDIHSNPKTSDNKPDKTIGVLSAIADKVTEILYGLKDLRTFIQDNSQLSHKICDRTIDEFESYLSALDSESKVSASGSVN